jgi:hypothetical protein
VSVVVCCVQALRKDGSGMFFAYLAASSSLDHYAGERCVISITSRYCQQPAGQHNPSQSRVRGPATKRVETAEMPTRNKARRTGSAFTLAGWINSIVTDSMKFLAGLEFVLRDGVPQEKLVALRQCTENRTVNKPAGQITLHIYFVPIGNLPDSRECTVRI